MMADCIQCGRPVVIEMEGAVHAECQQEPTLEEANE